MQTDFPVDCIIFGSPLGCLPCVALAQAQVTNQLQTQAAEKDAKIQALQSAVDTAQTLAQAKLDAELQRVVAAKDAELQALRSKLDGVAVQHELALSNAVTQVREERDTPCATKASIRTCPARRPLDVGVIGRVIEACWGDKHQLSCNRLPYGLVPFSHAASRMLTGNLRLKAPLDLP